MGVRFRIAIGLLVFVPAIRGQFVTHLKPATLAGFEQYSKAVETELGQRWSGKKPFLQAEDSRMELDRVLAGEFVIKEAPGQQPIPVPDGLIHDWTGSVFFSRANIADVLKTLENFDAHKNIYPQVLDSRTIRREGHDVTGYWRLQQKGIVPVSFNVEQEAHYRQISPGKWVGRVYARHIAEINPGLFAHGREYPAGEGHGYLWRLYAYWSLEPRNGGVLAECRSLSLSRDIPEGMAWAVNPFIQKMPLESLKSTLEATRQALSAR